jgi:hypothetical protein
VFNWDSPTGQTNKSLDDGQTTQSHVHAQVGHGGNNLFIKNNIHQFSNHMTSITEHGDPHNTDSIQCFRVAFFSCWYPTGGGKQLKPSPILGHTEHWSIQVLDVNESAMFIFLVIFI